MSKINFLIKLKNQGKLELVEPSEELKEAYLRKSESYLNSAKILFQSSHLEESVSMAYYSMYYILSALLFKVGIKCENHSGSIQISKELFGLNIKDILFAKKERIDKQYYIDFHITREDTNRHNQVQNIYEE